MIDKKELKKAYKRTLPPMGIYQIKNLINGKIFIGSSLNLRGKINRDKFQLQLGVHRNEELQKDFARLGEANFTFEVMDQLQPKDEPNYDYAADLAVLEEMWLEKLQPYEEKGYHERKPIVKGR
jgi:hypothetical protein